MQEENPQKIIVSVIIATRYRPKLLLRAISSVLAQTIKDFEVIIVIDGPDEATSLELANFDSPHFHVIQLPFNQGCPNARNQGVAIAKGEWIAFLDDDDEWLPTKLESQLWLAQQSAYQWPVISCGVIARTPKGDFTYPRRFPNKDEPLSEYLLARNTFSFGEGLIQASTLFTKKELLVHYPFLQDLGQEHEDWYWLLTISSLKNVGIEFVQRPLSIWHLWEQRDTISSNNKWERSLNWIKTNQALVTPRAYAAFILVEVGSRAAPTHNWKVFLSLLQEAVSSGKPAVIDWLIYLGMWFIPQDFRRSIKSFFQKTRLPIDTPQI